MKKARWKAVALTLAAAWLAARLVRRRRFPARGDRRVLFPEPMDPGLSLRKAFESLPDGGTTELMLLDDNVQAWVERWRLLEEARSRLDIHYFLLRQDVFGMSFLGHLVRKAREGVEIRLFLDGMGTKMSRTVRGNDYVDTLVGTEGIAVRMFRPLRYRWLDALLTLNPAAVIVSDHDKMLLADNRRGLTGGRNIGREYFAPPEVDPQVFRDTDVVLSGAGTGEALKDVFEAEFAGVEAHPMAREAVDLDDASADLLLACGAMDAWLAGEPVPPEVEAGIRKRGHPWLQDLEAMPQLRGAKGRETAPAVAAEVRLVNSRGRLGGGDDAITRTLVRLLRSARREVFIQSPYLVLPQAGAELLAEAARRGVRITIVTNSPLSSDNALSQAIFLEQWPQLLARASGLRLFVAGDRRNVHGKVAVFDRELTAIGTYNLDPVSIAMNSELMAFAWSARFAEAVLRPREDLLAAGTPRFLEYRIARDPAGNPRRGTNGNIRVEFGPEDHLRPEEIEAARRYRPLWRWVQKVTGKSPFWGAREGSPGRWRINH